MFGYVVANSGKLSPEEGMRYRCCYCGLCRALGDRHGALCRATINYDMTFLVLLLSSVYKAEGAAGTERCVVHPGRKHDYWRNEITDYAADMNIVLAYYDLLDDWMDDRRVFSLIEARLLEKEHLRVTTRYPDRCAAIGACMSELSRSERSGEPNPDVPANCFGRLMGEVFTMREDEYAGDVRAFGVALGRFVYVMDACLDLKRDIRKERYNPMVGTASEGFDAILNLLMADCTEKYKRLPVEQDRKLIENILYSGVWARYEASRKKTGKGGFP